MNRTKRNDNLILRNAAFLGPAGSQGTQGPQGPPGIVVLSANTADSAALSNVTAATAFSLNYSIAANSLAIGKVLRLKGAGTFSNTGAQTLSLYGQFGTSASNNLNYVLAGNNTGWWEIEAVLIVRTVGAGGTASLFLKTTFRDTALAGPQSNTIVSDVSINTTVANTVQIEFGSTVGANAATQLMFLLEALN